MRPESSRLYVLAPVIKNVRRGHVVNRECASCRPRGVTTMLDGTGFIIYHMTPVLRVTASDAAVYTARVTNAGVTVESAAATMMQ